MKEDEILVIDTTFWYPTNYYFVVISLITFQAVEAVFRFSVDMRDKDSASKVLTNGIFLCLFGMLIISLPLFPVFTRIEPFSSYLLFFYLILFFLCLITLTIRESIK